MTFAKFGDLPMELQLVIWRFAAPACIFKLGWGRSTAQPPHRVSLRPTNSIFHTCRAARGIILEGLFAGSFPSSAGLFKFSDTATGRIERFQFSTKLDNLWIPSDFLYHGIFDRRFTLDLGLHVRHLTTERHYIYDIHRTFPELVHQFFPNLDTLTILITNPSMFLTQNQATADPALYAALAGKLFPEIKEEINLNFRDEDLHFQFIIEHEQTSMKAVFQATKVKYPGRKVPALKFRDRDQFSASRKLMNG